MLKGERADELSMAVDTKAFHIHGLDIELISRAVRIVAVGAKHNAVRHRVPGRKSKLGFDLIVTGKTKIVDLFAVSLLLGAFVKLVTVLAGHLVSSMLAVGPILDVTQ